MCKQVISNNSEEKCSIIQYKVKDLKMENQQMIPECEVQESIVRLRHLQSQHKQLEQCLNERKHSLLLHSKMLNQMENKEARKINSQNQKLIEQLFKKQQDIQFAYADMLINGQIRIQQQLQYRDLIRQYQSRILELRTVMIDKEVELVSEMETKKKEFMPTKDRLKLFHQAQSEEANIRKLLQEYQALTSEVSSLEDEYRIRSQKTKDCTDTDEDNFQIGLVSSLKKSSTISTLRNQPQGAIFKDRLLSKVYNLLEEEIQTERILKQQFQSLKMQFNEASFKHKGLIKKYKQDQYNGGKILEESQYEESPLTLQQIPQNVEVTPLGVKDQNIMNVHNKIASSSKSRHQSINNFYKKNGNNKRLSCQN